MEHECPFCGTRIDAATGLTGDKVPDEGAVSICAYCTGVSVFTGDGLATRRPTREELVHIMADPVVRDAIAVLSSHPFGPR